MNFQQQRNIIRGGFGKIDVICMNKVAGEKSDVGGTNYQIIATEQEEPKPEQMQLKFGKITQQCLIFVEKKRSTG